MGEGNFGGNGSVKWDVRVEKQGRFNGGNNNPGGPHNADGTDDQFQSSFEILVKPPLGATSLGGAHTLVGHAASTTHRQMDPEARRRAGIADGLVRVSIGLEDVDDLIEDFDRALEKV